MKGLMLNKNSKTGRGSYFNMIGDDLITPTMSANLQEFYFDERVQDFKSKPELKTRVKALLRDTGSGVYFDPSWNRNLAIDDLTKMVIKSADNKVGTGLAWESLKQAKSNRQSAIDKLGSEWNITAKTARERVDDAIKRNYPTNSNLNNRNVQDLVKAAINNINDWVAFQTVADAYTNEIGRRMQLNDVVKKAILKGDVKEMKALSSMVKIDELKTSLDDAIKTIEEAKKAEEAKQKAIDEANRKLSGATTPEEKAAAQAELDALLRAGSEGAAAISRGTGLPKGAVYIGIGLVVAIGAYLMFRKKA